MTTPKLSSEYRVRWRRRGWHPDEFAHVDVRGGEAAALEAADFVAQQYGDVCEVVLEVRMTSRWRHDRILVLDETTRTPTRNLET